MSLNIIDVCIVLFILAGAVLGFKKGAVQTLAVLIGTIAIIVLAYYLKNPLSVFLYTYLPFFKLGGIFKGVTVVNILIYEAIAFFIALGLLSFLLGLILKVTGLISKVVDYSIILTLPSKIIGILIGVLEAYVFTFIVLFIISQFSFSHGILDGSKYADMILSKTPLTAGFKDSYNAFKDISKLNDSIGNNTNKKNYEALDILLKYNVITTESANKLVEKGKINIKGADKLIESYEVK